MGGARVVVVLALVFAGGCGDSASDPEGAKPQQVEESVTLTPGFREGDTAVFLHTEVSRQAQATTLHTVMREVRETRRFRLETLETEPGGVSRLRLVMERVTARVEDNGVEVFAFDSDMPREDGSGPARARAKLADLVAEVMIGTGGTVLGMSASLSAADLAEVPAKQRALFAENWFRTVIESLYRPLGERDVVAAGEVWEESAEPGAPFEGPEHVLVRESRVVEAGDEWVEIETDSVLHTAGEPRPESYSGVTRYRWSVGDGRLESLLRRQVVLIDRRIAGTEGRESAVREISLERINPGGSVTDKEER